MLVIVTTAAHDYTFRRFLSGAAFRGLSHRTTLLSYEALWRARTLPHGTWIFADLERLAPAERRRAGALADVLAAADPPCRILNHPARVRLRVALHAALRRAGFNDFRLLRADEGPVPGSWPVFVRGENDHDGPIGGLLHDQAALDGALAELDRHGRPLDGLVVSEWVDTSADRGAFHKYGAVRVGERLFQDHLYFSDQWMVKYPADGFTEPPWSEAELRYVHGSEHQEDLRAIYDIARIDYGRIDYAVVNGRIQVFELNTNPVIEAMHVLDPSPRDRARAIAFERLNDAMDALDSKTSARAVAVPVPDALRTPDPGPLRQLVRRLPGRVRFALSHARRRLRGDTFKIDRA